MSALKRGSVRSDYRATDDTSGKPILIHPEWTYGEAADYVGGRGWETIKQWASHPVEVKANGHTYRQYRFKIARRIGALRVDALSFMAYIKTGEPQGERA